MTRKNPFEVADESYEPCNPDSQPNTELVDYIKEPVDQWILDHETVTVETYKKAREVWVELGEQVVSEEFGSDYEGTPGMEADHIQAATGREVNVFGAKLQPMMFESFELHALPKELLIMEPEPTVIGQMFGVPREGGYVPMLVIDTFIDQEPIQCIETLHYFFHLLNDIYSDDPEEVQVVF